MKNKDNPMIYYVAMPQRVEAQLNHASDTPIKSDFQICPVCGVYLKFYGNPAGKPVSHFKHRHAPDIGCPLYSSHGGKASAVSERANRKKPDFAIKRWKEMLLRASGLDHMSTIEWMESDPTILPMLNTAAVRMAEDLPPLPIPARYEPGKLSRDHMDLLLLTSLSRSRNHNLRRELMKVACYVASLKWPKSRSKTSPRFLFQNDPDAQKIRGLAKHRRYAQRQENEAIRMLEEAVICVIARTHPL